MLLFVVGEGFYVGSHAIGLAVLGAGALLFGGSLSVAYTRHGWRPAAIVVGLGAAASAITAGASAYLIARASAGPGDITTVAFFVMDAGVALGAYRLARSKRMNAAAAVAAPVLF